MTRLAVVGVVLALVHLLLQRRLVRAPGLGGRPATLARAAIWGLWAITLVGLGTGTVFATAWSRPVGWLGHVWLAVVFYLLLGLAVVGILLLVLRVLRRPRLAVLRVLTSLLVTGSLGLVGYGVVEATRLHVVHAEVTLPGLPAELDGLRVGVAADLHVGPARGADLTRRVVDLMNAQRPDLVVLPGDLSDGTVRLVGRDLAPLAGLEARYGVYGVAGNHEAYSDSVGSWLDHWERLGIRTLRNEHVPVTVRGTTVTLAGVHDYRTPAPYAPDLAAALAGSPADRFTVLVAHQPAEVHRARRRGVDLQISAHTHGGQMWPLRPAAGWFNPTVSGQDTFGGTRIYTTIGAGAWGPPVRVGARPEIVVLTLRAG